MEAAAYEFAETEAMIARAEELFGPYEWDRYDMLVLPPSFPYGGMENPRMTFLTPTLLAGDRSLVDVVAHELAHSWTGNLVTNADMEHFWLNEGFTVWAERRILEALHGEEATVLALGDRREGARGVDGALRARLAAHAPAHRARRASTPTTPSPPMPYEKGARFVALLERTAGRERFDRFMRDYMARFRFTSITTEEFLAFLESELPGARRRGWAPTSGSTSPACRRTRPSSARRGSTASSALAQALAARRAAGRPAQIAGWSPAETARLPPAPAARARRARAAPGSTRPWA